MQSIIKEQEKSKKKIQDNQKCLRAATASDPRVKKQGNR